MKIQLGSVLLSSSGTKFSWSGDVSMREQVIKTAYGIILKNGKVYRVGDTIHIDNALVFCKDLCEELALGVWDFYYTKMTGEWRV